MVKRLRENHDSVTGAKGRQADRRAHIRSRTDRGLEVETKAATEGAYWWPARSAGKERGPEEVAMKQQTITTDDYAALVRNQWTEAEFTTAVIELAQANGWLAYHQRPARLKNGSWRTPGRGGKGVSARVLGAQ